MFDGPFRGYVPIADEVLIAARDVGCVIVEAAIVSVAPRKEPTPPLKQTIADVSEAVIGAVVRAASPKFDRVLSQRSALSCDIEVAARCALCRSTAVVLVSDHLTLVYDLEAIVDALSHLGCYCVVREVAL